MKGLTLILDLDGTLVDTAPDLIATANEMLRAMGAQPVDPESGRLAAGHGARRIIETALRDQRRALPREDRWADIIAGFIAIYRSRLARRSRPFDGMEEVLATCRDKGVRLGICTNKRHDLAEELLAALGLRRFFSAVVGGDSTARGKPDPMPVLHGISRCGGAAGRALMVGDSMSDIQAARAAGVTSVLAGWGYLDRPAAAFQADYALSSPAAILSLLRHVARGRAVGERG